MNTQLTCRISNTDPESAVGLEIWLNAELIYNSEHVSDPVDFEYQLNDDKEYRELRFVMKNKTQDHTHVDADGNITKDCCISIENLAFDGVDDWQWLFWDQAVYEHDFNGTQSVTKSKFYGMMGCNGVVSVKFFTPIYLWLIEIL